MRQVEEQRRHSNPLVHHDTDVSVRQRVGLAAQGADPEIRTAARVCPLDQVVADLPLPVADDMDALSLIRLHAGKIDVHEDVARPPDGNRLTDHFRSPMKGGLPKSWLGGVEML